MARTLAAHPALTLTLLTPPAEGWAAAAGGDDRAVRLFELLLAEAPERGWFESLLANAADYPPALLNRFFEAALTAGKVDADRVIRAQGPQLLDLFAGQSGLDKVGKLFLADPPADLLSNQSVLAFLGKLRDEAGVSDEVKGRVAAVQAVKAYLDAPDFDPDAMTAAAAGLTLTPPVVPPTAKGHVFAAVSAGVLERADSDRLERDLEAALLHFGGVLAADPTDLYENLLARPAVTNRLAAAPEPGDDVPGAGPGGGEKTRNWRHNSTGWTATPSRWRPTRRSGAAPDCWTRSTSGRPTGHGRRGCSGAS